MKKKKIYQLRILGDAVSKNILDDDFYTTDTDTWLEFSLVDTTLIPEAMSISLVNIDDGSVINEVVTLTKTKTILFRLDPDIIVHAGTWQGQIVFEAGGEMYTSSRFSFGIKSSIMDNKVPQLIKIANINHVNNMMDEFLDIIVNAREQVDENIVIAAVEAKYASLESEYAPRLTTLEQSDTELTTQLQQKPNKESVDFRQTSGKGTKAKDPTVIFVSDDVRLQDKSLLLPIMQRYNIPFVTAMSPNRNINRHEFGNLYLTVAEAKELQDIHGWEVVSHTWNHEHLPELNDEDLDYTLRHTREWMIENGFNGYDFLMYPFGEYDERVKRVTAKYYKAARTTGTPNYPPENKYPLSNYQLSTRFISQTVSLDVVKEDVSRLIRDDGLLIIFFHGQEIEMWGREAFLEDVISYVKSEETYGRLKIKNFRQTFETQENIIDQVNYTDKYDDQFVIGANGKVQSNIARTKLLKPNSVTSTTLPELYPHDFISMCTISNTTGGFPILGTLVTHRFSNNENTIANAGYTHQTLYGYNSSRVMTRNFMGGAWTPFSDSGGSSGGGIITGSGYNGETSPATFNMGISYHTIGSGSAGMPVTTGGIMKTVKVSAYDFWYQEFKPVVSNDLWRRYASSGTTWGTFVKVTSASGTTSNRPTGISIGYSYFDTTIGKPIWLKSIGVWVDSTGATV